MTRTTDFAKAVSALGLALWSACALAQAGARPARTPPRAYPSTQFSPADEALYMRRWDAFSAAKGALDIYDPMEPMPGAARPQPLPLATPAERSIAPDALAAARQYAGAANSKALLVWRDGKLQSADYFGGTTPDTPIVARSLAKPLSAIAVGRAISLGKVRALDQPAADFIREWRGTPKAAITIRMLLSMRSGLVGQDFAMDPTNIWSRAYLHPRHDAIMIHDYPLINTPGERYDYSNVNGDLIALILDRATGRRYAEFVSTEILKPLAAAGGDIWVDRPGGTAHSGCCSRLPAESWLKLGLLLLQDGMWNGKRLLPAGYVTQMRTASKQNPHYGLGVYVGEPYAPRRGFSNPDDPRDRGVLHSEPYLAKDLFLFDGNANQVVYLVPSARLAVLRVGNPPPRTPEWDNSMLPNTILRGLR